MGLRRLIATHVHAPPQETRFRVDNISVFLSFPCCKTENGREKRTRTTERVSWISAGGTWIEGHEHALIARRLIMPRLIIFEDGAGLREKSLIVSVRHFDRNRRGKLLGWYIKFGKMEDLTFLVYSSDLRCKIDTEVDSTENASSMK